MIIMGGIRCPNCNLSYAVEIKKQPNGEGLFRNFLRKRTYIHCLACGHFEDMDDYKKRTLQP